MKNKAFGQPVVSEEWRIHCENTHITFGLVSVLTPQAWKKRWFVLRSGRMTGDPDVLEYYKNDHAKKPIRVIDLNLCEQVWSVITTLTNMVQLWIDIHVPDLRHNSATKHKLALKKWLFDKRVFCMEDSLDMDRKCNCNPQFKQGQTEATL